MCPGSSLVPDLPDGRTGPSLYAPVGVLRDPLLGFDLALSRAVVGELKAHAEFGCKVELNFLAEQRRLIRQVAKMIVSSTCSLEGHWSPNVPQLSVEFIIPGENLCCSDQVVSYETRGAAGRATRRTA